MNFSEFKQRIGAEPRSQDPEIQAARASGEEFEEAAFEAEVFEQKLESALCFDVDEKELASRLLGILDDEASSTRWNWMAVAASVLVFMGAATVAWQQMTMPRTLDDYVASHYAHDGDKLLSLANGFADPEQVTEVMARLSASISPALAERVRYIKFCPTLHGRGAHMVLASESGPVSVIYMPNTTVEHPVLISLDSNQAEVIGLQAGSAAIIGPGNGIDPGIQVLLRESITAGSLET